jgi:hypothetical protein
VVRAIGLASAESIDLGEGIPRIYSRDGGVLMFPPLDGWTLVAGLDLPVWLDRGTLDTAALSTRLGAEVQFFATHRVVEAHHWERSIDGRLVRRFRFVGDSGEVEANEGALTDVEFEHHLDEFLAAGFTQRLRLAPDESTVFAVATDWSIDPTRLDERAIDDTRGTWGSWPHDD